MLSTRLGELVANQLPPLAADLEAAARRSGAGRDRQALLEASAQLKLAPGARRGVFTAAFEDRVLRALNAAGLGDAATRSLALVHDEALDLQIIAQDLARSIRDAAAGTYPSYADRVRTVSPSQWIEDELNPFGAGVIASAVVAAVGPALSSAPVKAMLRTGLQSHFALPVAEVLVEIEAWLDGHGIEPTRVEIESAEPSDSGEPDPAIISAPSVHPVDTPRERHAGEDAVIGDLAQEAPDAIAGSAGDAALLETSALARHRAARPLRRLPTLEPVASIEQNAVAFAHSIGEIPYSRGARGHFFGNVRQRLADNGAGAEQLAVVDVVGAMFDYVVDDRTMPDAAKPLVWRLQQPAVVLTLLDSGYLGDDQRSLRRLVENFGAILTTYGEDVTRGSELHRRLETVVRAVEIVTRALQARSAVIAHQVDREYERAALGVGQLVDRVVRERTALESTPGRRNRRNYASRPDRGREQAVTEKLSALIEERLAAGEYPESVREFLSKVWLRQLRTAALRDGEGSVEFKIALQVVDDLLWTLDGKSRDGQPEPSRKLLAERIPPLIRVLGQGLREIGAREDEHQSFFDELFLIHLRRMQKRRRDGAADPANAAAGEAPAVVRPPEESAGDHGTTVYDVQPVVPTLNETLSDLPAGEAEPDGVGGQAFDAADQEAAEPTESAAPASDSAGNHRLLEVLGAADLSDLPTDANRRLMAPEAAFAAIRRGDWVELEGRNGERSFLKIAWINRRRTVCLLVRSPDRRALSLRMSELRTRFVDGRAFAIEPARAA
ncbi:MAG: DUF1631 family protein [Burkholderiaceae bacterium]|nr:DUF1631 family protein [Burkholderiaceae bacterium]